MCAKEKNAPALPDNTPGVNKFRYKQQYGVIIICKDEAEHKKTYERIAALGYKCKAVRVRISASTIKARLSTPTGRLVSDPSTTWKTPTLPWRRIAA